MDKQLILQPALHIRENFPVTNELKNECLDEIDLNLTLEDISSCKGFDYKREQYKIDDCKNMERYTPLSHDEEWSEEYGQYYHGCFDYIINNAKEAGCNSNMIKYLQTQKSCDSSILAVLTIFTAAFIF